MEEKCISAYFQDLFFFHFFIFQQKLFMLVWVSRLTHPNVTQTAARRDLKPLDDCCTAEFSRETDRWRVSRRSICEIELLF